MVVCHYSVRDISASGGGVRATYFIHQLLWRAGYDSRLFVAAKTTDDPTVSRIANNNIIQQLHSRFNFGLNRLVYHWSGTPKLFTTDILGAPDSALYASAKSADIVHLHWVAGLVMSRQIRSMFRRTKAPVVWTLMDIAPLTGGCHYALGCNGFKHKCGHCPHIRSNTAYDLSRWNWWHKYRDLHNVPITFVAPTQWVADRIKESSLFSNNTVAMIPLPINIEVFRPLAPEVAREVLGLPLDKRIIFFGATYLSEERKGARYFIEALQYLSNRLRETSSPLEHEVVIAVAGMHGAIPSDLPFPTYNLGYLHDERTLALAYQASDIFVCPSIEDAGPMMIPEAMLCGLPVVAFKSGGAPDLIETLKTGYLAKLKDSSDLANGILALLSSERLSQISRAAHAAAMKAHAPATVVAQYSDLYNSILGR